MQKILTEQEAKGWLETNFPRYKIISWGGSFLNTSLFLDSVRDVKFNKSFSKLKYILKDNPNHIFKPTKQERAEILKQTCLKNYGVENRFQSNIIKQKCKETCLKKYGTEHCQQNKQIKEKTQKTNIEKYGNVCSLHGEEQTKKKTKTWMKNLGTSNPFKSCTIQQKCKETCIKKYGVENPFQAEIFKQKIKQTNFKKYGAEHASQNKEIQEKIKQTNLEKYGFESPLQNQRVQEKQKQTRIKNGNIKIINGKTLKEIAKEKNIGYTTAQQIYHKHGEEFLLKHKRKGNRKTDLEQIMSQFLDSINIEYVHNKQLPNIKSISETAYQPDFRIDSHKLIIECNGSYHHSDEFKNKDYHLDRKNKFEELGYKSLFFNGDEIKNKFHIVKSIILNKLGLSQKIFARKCSFVCEGTNKFFERNHLMGKGSGRIYSLKFGEEIVASMQVKWKSLNNKSLEVSRFCTKNNVNVVGGFSKLLKHILEIEKPNKVITFIDRRYGDGNYLNDLGFKKVNEDLSFVWARGKKVFHRMNFPGNSGYEHGFFKLWDCGQAKYELNTNKEN